MKKLIQGIIAAFAMLLFLFPSSSVSASENDETATLENVEQLLVESPESLEEYQNLSIEDQNLFVDSLNDPEIFKENVEVEEEEFVTEEPTGLESNNMFSIAATSYTTTLTTRHSMGVLGVNLITYRHVLVYNRSGGKATKILSNQAVVERSVNPAFNTGVSSKGSYISNGKAYASADFYYNIGPFKGLSMQIGTMHHNLVGDGSGIIRINSWTKQ